MGELTLKSNFKNNAVIPAKYTCDGDNINPLIEMLNVPPEAKCLVFIIDDPDATVGGVWDHWVLFNIDPKTHYIPEDSLPSGAVKGKNSFGKLNYGGPCPPRGNAAHHYRFKLYVLDSILNLQEGATKADVEREMGNHILSQTTLTGLYERKPQDV